MKSIKILILALLVGGLVLLISGFVILRGDITKIRSSYIVDDQYEEINQFGNENLNTILIKGRDHRIIVSRSLDETYQLNYFVSERDNFTFSVENGVLSLQNNYVNTWFDFSLKTDAVNAIYLTIPLSFAGEFDLKSTTGIISMMDLGNVNQIMARTTTGNISVDQALVATTIQLNSTTGNLTIQSSTAENITVGATTGRVVCENVVATNRIKATTTVGRVHMMQSSAQELELKTTTGRIILNAVNASKITAEATTGSIEGTQVETNEIYCDNTTGRIQLAIKGDPTNYQINVRTSTGTMYYQDQKITGQQIESNPVGATKKVNIKTTNGNITLTIQPLEG